MIKYRLDRLLKTHLYENNEIDKKKPLSTMDKNERAHMDYNRENGTITFIHNVLTKGQGILRNHPTLFKIRDSDHQ